jgi:predicted enzyme involved in methoxymalonyl-ACP biosynthesis
VRAAAKATMASFKAVELPKFGDSCIVGVRVIEHKIGEVSVDNIWVQSRVEGAWRSHDINSHVNGHVVKFIQRTTKSLISILCVLW